MYNITIGEMFIVKHAFQPMKKILLPYGLTTFRSTALKRTRFGSTIRNDSVTSQESRTVGTWSASRT